MDLISELENQSIYIIREAHYRFPNLALLWSIGKDSTTLLWLCRKAFFGTIPFPVIHIDTTFKFPEMYAFRDHYTKEFNIDLVIAKNEEALNSGINYTMHDVFTCSNELKTKPLMQIVKERHLQAVIVGIRRDEHGIRAKERFFSPRNEMSQWNYASQPAEVFDQLRGNSTSGSHVRIHPLLGWREVDIWKYIQRENMPVNPLYFAKNGKRYRSLGCMPITSPIDSNASTIPEIIQEIEESQTSERAGRGQDKENGFLMQKLRALGYM